MEKCFAVSLGAQKDLIDAHCFGDCGKIRVGGIVIETEQGSGSFLPCTELECPHLDKESDFSVEIMLANVAYECFMRKLK